MPLLVLGLNHRTAPIEIRERVAFDAARLPAALAELASQPGIRESLILSTCNRTEIYCSVDPGAAAPRAWLEQGRGTGPDLSACIYVHEEDAAIGHLYGVAAGLDSLVLGEPQILGQLKDAYRAAFDAGTVGPTLHRLFQSTFGVAKRIRTETAIGASAVSVASAAVALARRVFAGLGQHTALLVGAGEMIELTARHLRAQGIGNLIIANRSPQHARRIAEAFQASAIALDALAAHLPQADIVFSSTASPDPVISLAMVEQAIVARRRRPIFMVDIAVPRDIEPAVAALEDVYLYTIDDLRGVVDENLKARQQEAEAAQHIIRDEVRQFVETLRSLGAVPAIRELRGRAEELREQTLEQAQRMLAAGRPPAEALEFLANTLTQRLMHAPSTALREAARSGDDELGSAARRLHRIDES